MKIKELTQQDSRIVKRVATEWMQEQGKERAVTVRRERGGKEVISRNLGNKGNIFILEV